MPDEFRMVAKTLFGLEGVLADELRLFVGDDEAAYLLKS